MNLAVPLSHLLIVKTIRKLNLRHGEKFEIEILAVVVHVLQITQK